jgi:CRP/FNR family transcriptional regulator
MGFHATIAINRCDDCSTRSNSCLGWLYSAGGCDPSGHIGSSVLERGQHLFHSGDPVTSVYILRSGALKTYVTSPDGEEQILAFFSPGDVVGLDGLADGHHSRNTIALEATEVCRVPVERLLQSCSRDAELQGRLLEGMGREIQRLQGMLKLERLTAEQRVVYFLLNQARRQARPDTQDTVCVVHLAMSRGEIGRFLDLATETVSRCLTRLQNLGLIAINRNEIELVDVRKMQRLGQQQSAARTATERAVA